MVVNIFGLRCDNPMCDYSDEAIQLEEYPKYIGHPCPKCGQSLLTQADFDTMMSIVKMTELVNKLGLDAGSPEDEETYKVSVQLDGSGVPKINITDLK